MTRGFSGLFAVGALATAVLLGACGADPAFGAPPVESSPSTDVTEKNFDAGNFPAAPKVDNPWYPLTPGTQYVLEGAANRGKGTLPHQVVFTVTDLVKVINGVPTVVLWDIDTREGQLQESELVFQAQDNDGNVWLLGKYPEEYEDGKFATAESTWFAGLEGARPGVLMRANPRTGTSSYLQGLAPKIEFQDRAKVSKSGLRTCVPLKCYDDVLLIDEWNSVEPESGKQLRYYASGVGNVRVGAVGDPEAEELVLVQVNQLSPAELAKARAEALKLEQHAYQVSADLYGRTPPAVATGSDDGSGSDDSSTNNSGDDGLAWVPFGPDDPKSPIPGPWPVYNAFAEKPPDCAYLQSKAEQSFRDLGQAMVALCLAAVEGRQDKWEVARAFAAGPGSSNSCLNGEVRRLLSSALAWHQRHPGQKPVLRFLSVSGPEDERQTDCGKKETGQEEIEPTETPPTETPPTETPPTETPPTETPPTETAPTETAPTETAG